MLNRTAEFLAGQDHFKNFLSFKNNGGTENLVNKTGMKIVDRNTDVTGTSSIVKVK